MKRITMALALAAMTLGTVGRANAILTFYVNRPAFNAANPGLPVEGFENGSHVTQAFTGPLDSTTNNGPYQPGDILPGIQFVDNPGPGNGEMFIAAPGQSSNPTTAIGQNFPSTDAMDILLNPGVDAVAFDIFQNFGGGSQSGQTQLYPVSIFGASGLLGTTSIAVPSGQMGFFGVSTSNPGEIIRVSVNHPTAFDVIDNVAFGRSVQDVPEPGTVAFAGAIGVCLIAFRRSRSRAKG